MKRLLILFFFIPFLSTAQKMTPELLWQTGRVSAIGLSNDKTELLYRVSTPDMEKNSIESFTYALNLENKTVKPVDDISSYIRDEDISRDGKFILSSKEIKVKKIQAEDYYPELEKSDALIIDQLHFRHWDTWSDGTFSHIFIENVDATRTPIDIMEGEPFHSPTRPFGGSEDYTWNPEGTEVLYVAKKKFGNEYVTTTNTDIYAYSVADGSTRNITSDNPGYDMSPLFSGKELLAWLSMARDGYESDKNDIKILLGNETLNLTAGWDGTVNEFIWSNDGKTIFFTAPIAGTVQLFSVAIPKKVSKLNPVKQITSGQWDISGLVGEVDNNIIAGRTDMNRAKEIFEINLKDGSMTQLTTVNDELYAGITPSRVEKRMVPTTDGKEMVTWVIYPPDFDASQKYPTLLYTQGGPQSALSQFYSFRWNFQVMAAQGYIVVAPNRRGMPGHGVEWNEQISGDWGGQNMQDYLSAIDHVAEEPYVDKENIACVGASYGGYSAFYLAGVHEGRFKSFIAHDGIFNLKSMYGTTEELFFVNWDMGGPYWDTQNTKAQKTYKDFNPIDRVAEWDTPILIIQGGKDFRVPEGQAFEAFTAAQQRGIESRLLYFPEENHWVLKPQNGLVWQKEFFRWLEETLN